MWYVDGFAIIADGSGFWAVDDSDVNFLTGAARDLRSVLFAVPPGATAAFEVSVHFSWYADDGSISIDFASKPNFKIASLLQLELLTAPSFAGALDGGQSPPKAPAPRSLAIRDDLRRLVVGEPRLPAPYPRATVARAGNQTGAAAAGVGALAL